MKVIVNLPQTDEDIKQLEQRVADFHATLLIEKIKQLDLTDKDKDKILNLILDKIKSDLTNKKGV